MRLPVLMYHRIGAVCSDTWPSLTLTPETFAGQVRWLLEHGYTGIHSSEWLRWIQTGKGLPGKPVLLTFDDAYADLVEHAFPVLKHYGFKATVFVVTGHIGGNSTWDRAFGYPALALMSEAQIRHWSQQGIEFGAHTRTHADLRGIGTTELDCEMQGCKEDLVRILNKPVTSFAYPFGLYDDRVRKRAMAIFDSAFTCHAGSNRRRTDLHQLRRTLVDVRNPLLFSTVVSSGWNVSELLDSKLKGIRHRLRRLNSAVHHSP